MDIVSYLLGGGSVIVLLPVLYFLLLRRWLEAKVEAAVKLEYDKKFKAHIDQHKADKDLFALFKETLPSNGYSMELMRKHDFRGAFPEKSLEQLRAFYFGWNTPDRHFLDQEIEGKREHLYRVVDAFIDFYSGKVSEPEHMKGYLKISLECESECWNAAEVLNSSAEQVVKAHDDLVTTARNKLKC